MMKAGAAAIQLGLDNCCAAEDAYSVVDGEDLAGVAEKPRG
jgi:hypothetical protein